MYMQNQKNSQHKEGWMHTHCNRTWYNIYNPFLLDGLDGNYKNIFGVDPDIWTTTYVAQMHTTK